MGCEFESYACRNKNAIGDEGNGKPPIKSTSLGKTQIPVSGSCCTLNRVCNTNIQCLQYTAMYCNNSTIKPCVTRKVLCEALTESGKEPLIAGN